MKYWLLRNSLSEKFGELRSTLRLTYVELDARLRRGEYVPEIVAADDERLPMPTFPYIGPGVFAYRNDMDVELQELIQSTCYTVAARGKHLYTVFLPREIVGALSLEYSEVDYFRSSRRISQVRRLAIDLRKLGSSSLFRLKGDSAVFQHVLATDKFRDLYIRHNCSGLTFGELKQGKTTEFIAVRQLAWPMSDST